MRYLFQCVDCGEFEVNMSYKDLPLKNCPTCNKDNPERIYSSFHTGHVNGFCGNSNTWSNNKSNGGK